MSTLSHRVLRLALSLVLALPVLLLGTDRAGADDPTFGDTGAQVRAIQNRLISAGRRSSAGRRRVGRSPRTGPARRVRGSVDLNRNFPHRWISRANSGPYAASGKETRDANAVLSAIGGCRA